MKLREIRDFFIKELEPIYQPEESQVILSYILMDALEIPKLVILSQPQLELNPEQDEKIRSLLNDLKKGIPVQHLLGKAHFYGMELKVTPDVLIPRQETEELVDWIIKETKESKLKILDVCTGSGCIALALKKHLPETEITAIDISEKALEVAQYNAKKLGLSIDFIKADALHLEKELKGKVFDIIVSNPPYIAASEKDSVQRSVYMYEPHLALFVPDSNPLLFYESIARYAKQFKSTLYFEIYEDRGNDLVGLMNDLVFRYITIKKDLNGKNRMLKCRHF